MPASGQRTMQVVIEQPPGGLLCIRRILCGGQGTGVLAEQVVQLEAAGRGLGNQMLVIQLVELPSRGGHPDAGQSGSGVSINARPWDQAELAEQALLAW